MMKRTRSSGQALVECVVAAMFVLAPLLLAVSALGKLADVRHTTLMAARYAAWERTVWYDAGAPSADRFDALNGANRKSAAQIRAEIAQRLVNDRGAISGAISGTIRRTDGAARGFGNGIDPLWRDGAGRAFLADDDQVDATLAQRTPGTDIAGAALAAVHAAPPLPDATLAVADVALRRIAAGSRVYAGLWPDAAHGRAGWPGLDVEARGAILSNTWSANGAQATARMVAASAPLAQDLGKTIDGTVSAAMRAWDPLLPAPEFGKIAPDVVPPDRLRP